MASRAGQEGKRSVLVQNVPAAARSQRFSCRTCLPPLYTRIVKTMLPWTTIKIKMQTIWSNLPVALAVLAPSVQLRNKNQQNWETQVWWLELNVIKPRSNNFALPCHSVTHVVVEVWPRFWTSNWSLLKLLPCFWTESFLVIENINFVKCVGLNRTFCEAIHKRFHKCLLQILTRLCDDETEVWIELGHSVKS